MLLASSDFFLNFVEWSGWRMYYEDHWRFLSIKKLFHAIINLSYPTIVFSHSKKICICIFWLFAVIIWLNAKLPYLHQLSSLLYIFSVNSSSVFLCGKPYAHWPHTFNQNPQAIRFTQSRKNGEAATCLAGMLAAEKLPSKVLLFKHYSTKFCILRISFLAAVKAKILECDPLWCTPCKQCFIRSPILS